ncbi:MAG: hypothetical protein ABGY42_10450, partial [bacterium]
IEDLVTAQGLDIHVPPGSVINRHIPFAPGKHAASERRRATPGPLDPRNRSLLLSIPLFGVGPVH